MKNSSHDTNPVDELNKVIIENGNILSGGLDKGIFTKTSKGLIHTIYNDLGPNETKDFIDDLQKISSYFLIIECFSSELSFIFSTSPIFIYFSKLNKLIRNFLRLVSVAFKNSNKSIEL